MNRIKFWKTMLAAMVFIAAASGLRAQSTTAVYPTNGSVCIPYALTLQWQPMLNAISYDVVVSKTPDFDAASIVVDVTGVLANSLPVTLAPNQFYYWRVNTVYAEGSALSGTFGFFTKQLTPSATSPANGATCLNQVVRLEWNATPGASDYRIQASENPSFTSLVISRSGINRLYDSIPLPKLGTTYYWRVRANVNDCETDWSTPFSFTTKPAPPEIVAPADSAFGATLFASSPYTARFTWRKTDNASLYTIQFSETSNFSVAASADITDTTLVQSFGSTGNKKYFWRVRSQVNGCWSDYSAARVFKTPYDSTRLVYPDTNAQCLPTKSVLRWNKMGAFKYRVQVARDANFNTGNLTYNAVVSDTTFTTDFHDGSLSYYWRVRGEDSLNVGFWSQPRLFVTTFNPPVVPTDTVTSAPLNYSFSWNEFNTAALYSVQVSNSPSFGTTIANAVDLAVPNFSVILPEYGKTYYWRVKQKIGACESDWSSVVTFKTMLPPVTGITPPDSATKVNVRPEFSWTTLTGAVGYDINVATDPQFKNVIRFENGVKSNKVIFPEFDELTKYFWRVRATAGPGLEGAWSKTYVFTTGIRDIGDVIIISPVNQTKNLPYSSVTFKWNRVATAENYRLQLSTSEPMTNLLLDTVLTVAGSSAVDSFSVANLTPGTEYFWRVQASNQYHTSKWSPVFSFRTAPLPPTVKAELLTPENDAKDQARNLTFTWTPVSAVEGYELQIATTADFQEGTFAFNSTFVWSTVKYVYDLSPNAKYYWRVRGWNGGGSGPWSDVYSFETGVKVSISDPVNAFKAILAPNPAGSSSVLDFELPKGGETTIEIYDVRGSRAAVAFNGTLSAGPHTLPLELNGLPSGSYSVVVVSGGTRQSVSLIVKK